MADWLNQAPPPYEETVQTYLNASSEISHEMHEEIRMSGENMPSLRYCTSFQ